MRDYTLTFPGEQTAKIALPEFRIETEDGEQWTGAIITNCTRWIQRPNYDENGEVISQPEIVPGWHCIIRAESLPEAALPYFVEEPGDIEPVPAGGLLKEAVPELITRLQARLALIDAGLWSAIMDWSKSADPYTQAFFEDAQEWRRDNPILTASAEIFGVTERNLDALFVKAAKL